MPPHRPDASHGQGTKRSTGNSSSRNRTSMANSRRPKKELLTHTGDQEFYLDRQTANPVESVASLVRRLGTPPQDLVDYLCEQFAVVCQDKASNGAPLRRVDLADWAIDCQGKLRFTAEDTRHETGDAIKGATDTSELTNQFISCLTAPHSTLQTSRALENRALENRASKEWQPVPASPTGLLEWQSEEHSTTSFLGEVQQNHRDQIIETFSAALADRFGPQILADSDGGEDQKSRAIKLQPLERDRRFNWNLVLGVGTATAVLALIWVGFQVSKIRRQRLGDLTGPTAQTVSDPKQESRAPVQTSGVSQSDDAFTPTDGVVRRAKNRPNEANAQSPPEIATQSPEPIEFSPASAFRDLPVKVNSTGDPIDDLLIDLNQIRPTDQSDVIPADLDGALDRNGPPKESVDTELGFANLDSYFPNVSPDSKAPPLPLVPKPAANGDTEPFSESLKSVLDGDEADGESPESSQETRPAVDRFIKLPPASQVETETIIDDSGVAIRQIEFPFDAPVTLSKSPADDTLNLCDAKDGNPIGRFSTDGQTTRFAWTVAAAKKKSADQLLDGRLIDENGGSIFLRPSIETDAYGLSLNLRRRRPSWTIGAPILPNLTRLNLDLTVPESIDLAWETPFNSTRPRRGTAIAILSPKDGESVEIAIEFDIDCSRKLTCRMRYAGRLGPNMPWQLMTESGFRAQAKFIQERRATVTLRMEQLQQEYDQAGLTQRRLLRKRKDEIEQIQKQIELTAQRMNMLGALAMEMESKVALTMHLFVQWPDSQQTILRTVIPGEIPGEIPGAAE